MSAKSEAKWARLRFFEDWAEALEQNEAYDLRNPWKQARPILVQRVRGPLSPAVRLSLGAAMMMGGYPVRLRRGGF